VNASVIRNIDTRFKYFKFPVENIAVPDISFEGFGVDDLVDLVYAKYRPSEDRPANSTTTYSGILMDTVLAGQPQLNTNSYTITPQIKELIVDGLRMRIRIRHSYSTTGIDLGNSRLEIDNSGQFLVTFREDYSNLRTEVQARLQAASNDNQFNNAEDWWEDDFGEALIWFNQLILQGESRDNARTIIVDSYSNVVFSSFTDTDDLADQVIEVWDDIRIVQDNNNKGTIFFSLIKRTENGDIIRDFRELTVDAGVLTAVIAANTTKVSEYDIIIPAVDFQAGDRFNIGAQVGQAPQNEDPLRFVREQHTILSDNTYWSITDASKNVDVDNNEIE
jgi:hypothetical protein